MIRTVYGTKWKAKKAARAPRPSWDMMIRDAEEQIRGLKWTIEVCRRRKAAGDPFPVPAPAPDKT